MLRAYPRERGGNRIVLISCLAVAGLSPRTRGKLALSGALSAMGGPIPANAGETKWDRVAVRGSSAYPRERGGNSPAHFVIRFREGLSPRTRGKHNAQLCQHHGDGPIPANAGETAKKNPAHGRAGAYPRERGGNASLLGVPKCPQGLSPRTRGKLTA